MWKTRGPVTRAGDNPHTEPGVRHRRTDLPLAPRASCVITETL